jgi:hypothetical protein
MEGMLDYLTPSRTASGNRLQPCGADPDCGNELDDLLQTQGLTEMRLQNELVPLPKTNL